MANRNRSEESAPANPTAEEQNVTGANAAVGAVNPAESQIRGSFMPGGGAGENATTLVDADTHAQFDATASAEEQEAAISEAREAAQKQYDEDLANPDVEMVAARPGARG